MIDGVYIFTKGGLVLWCYNVKPSLETCLRELLSSVIQSFFLEGKALRNEKAESFVVQDYHVCYHHMNRLETEMVAFFSGNTEARYAKKVLSRLAKELFVMIDKVFPALEIATATSQGNPRITLLQEQLWSYCHEEAVKQEITDHYHSIVDAVDTEFYREKAAGTDDESKMETSQARASQVLKAKKKPTVFDTHKVTRRAMLNLDLSSCEKYPETVQNEDMSSSRTLSHQFLPEVSDDDDDDEETEGKKNFSSGFCCFLTRLKDSVQQSFTGNKVLTEQNLDCIMEDFQQQLLKKNVALDMVDLLIESVKAELLGKRTVSFQSVKAAVYEAVKKSLERILTREGVTDVMKNVLRAKEKSQGVNGVGKSTSLAKVAYYLKHKGKFRVLVSACDTFRAGAVEQLRTHTKNLGIDLFEQGYGKDAALLCKKSLAYAQSNNYDVVLIDTAGRMQDNEPLMRSLSKLVALNSPDLILFVAEALVGNDATHQLMKFNQCLVDFAPSHVQQPREIDAIFLTKFDTVDSKVGAALSLTYVSGRPIAFVGTGQSYTHIERPKVHSLVQSLMSPN